MLINFKLRVVGACWIVNMNYDFGQFSKFRTERSVTTSLLRWS